MVAVAPRPKTTEEARYALVGALAAHARCQQRSPFRFLRGERQTPDANNGVCAVGSVEEDCGVCLVLSERLVAEWRVGEHGGSRGPYARPAEEEGSLRTKTAVGPVYGSMGRFARTVAVAPYRDGTVNA
ncbi:hypothetical protein HDU85_004007 [Gaertneriomyces sp. JEL0708]|nr:hypothetical protein HDU85_004007 [Gaertneriomyces sp. JEL0708]